ncbi:MAG: arsenite efflux transporter metallochaperone ArsD [Actinomycetales bacterium]|nr:arsenite efflux transporter metallochaperone ArsD [Actinomycetales bacterium]
MRSPNRSPCCPPSPAPPTAPPTEEPTVTTHEADKIRSAVQERYAEAARNVSSCCGPAAYTDAAPFGQSQYDDAARDLLPQEAITASLGCGNPTLLAALQPGDVVLDLGSGGGIDVLLSARRVAPDGKAYGLDMTPEMLVLANANKAKAGVENVEFLLGSIEDIPLPDDSVDVIISNCVVNLSVDKAQVFREAFRVLRPGGRLAISDVILSRPLSPDLTQVMALWTGCIAGALVEADAVALMQAAGFERVDIEPTNVFGRRELEGLAAGLRPPDLPASADLDTLIADFDGVIRNASLRATKPLMQRTGSPTTESEETRMPSVHVYEPALCCNTGVCGEDVDQRLVELTADLNHLTAQGADIARHNLANDPLAFASQDAVRSFLEVAGSEGLPLTTVDGVTVLTGAYPTRDQLLRYTGLTAPTPTLMQTPVAVPAGATELALAEDSGCGPTGCC